MEKVVGGVKVSSIVVRPEQHQGKRSGVPLSNTGCICHKLMHHIQLLLDQPVKRVHPAYTGCYLHEQFIIAVFLPDMGHFMDKDLLTLLIACGHAIPPE